MYRFVSYGGVPFSTLWEPADFLKASASQRTCIIFLHRMLALEAVCCLAYRRVELARTGLSQLGYGGQIRALQLTV